MEQAETRRKKIAAKKKAPKSKLTPDDLPALDELIRVPRAWYLDPMRKSMRLLVRPCTGLTRRKQLVIKDRLPTPPRERPT